MHLVADISCVKSLKCVKIHRAVASLSPIYVRYLDLLFLSADQRANGGYGIVVQ